MIITLLNPISPPSIDAACVQAIKLENNRRRGQRWVEAWVTWGYLETPGDEDTFVEWMSHDTGEGLLYLKFENGQHPERSGLSLGQCDTCNAWHFKSRGPCEMDGCDGGVSPYRAFQNVWRADVTGRVGPKLFDFITEYLVTESLPDPDDITDIRPILIGAIA